MVAGRGDMLKCGRLVLDTQQQSHIPKRLCIIKPIQRVAGNDTRFAARTAIQIDFKRKLLSLAGHRQRQKIPIVHSLLRLLL